MTFSAVMSGVSTAYSNNSLQYFVRSSYYKLTTDFATIYTINAVAEQILDIYTWIDNNTSDELMVTDMERGLVWFILPHQSLRLKINNPEASRLRISNPKCDFVRYASIIAGSSVTKWGVSYEDDECWVVPIFIDDEIRPEKYRWIRKSDYIEEDMGIKEFADFKKKMKNQDK